MLCLSFNCSYLISLSCFGVWGSLELFFVGAFLFCFFVHLFLLLLSSKHCLRHHCATG